MNCVLRLNQSEPTLLLSCGTGKRFLDTWCYQWTPPRCAYSGLIVDSFFYVNIYYIWSQTNICPEATRNYQTFSRSAGSGDEIVTERKNKKMKPNLYLGRFLIRKARVINDTIIHNNNSQQTCTYVVLILYQGPKLWNSLPISITGSTSFSIFKKKMIEFVMNRV